MSGISWWLLRYVILTTPTAAHSQFLVSRRYRSDFCPTILHRPRKRRAIGESICEYLRPAKDIVQSLKAPKTIKTYSITDKSSSQITRFALKTRENHRLEICGPESAVPTIQSSRTNSVVSRSTSSSGSWQSVRSANSRPPAPSQLTRSALRNFLQQPANFRGPPAYCNPSHLGRSGTIRPLDMTSPASRSVASSTGASTVRNPDVSFPNEESRVIGDNSAGNSNTVPQPGQDPAGTQAIPSGSPPLASSATLQVSRRASFFGNFKKSSGGS